MSVVIPCHIPERQFTLKYNLQPFWIPEYSSFDSSHIVLTVDEMIRLLTWLFGFFVPRFHGYSQGFAQWHGLWRSCRSSEGRRTLPRNSTLRIPPARWSSPESKGQGETRRGLGRRKQKTQGRSRCGSGIWKLTEPFPNFAWLKMLKQVCSRNPIRRHIFEHLYIC